MAQIEEKLVLQDQFSSPLDRFISKMEKAASAQAENRAATAQMSAATQELVDRLTPLQSAFQEAFTEKEANRNINELISSMQRLGLVWTSTDAEAHAADLILNDGLQELANQGMITADAVARASYEERTAKAAAKQAALEEKEAAKQAAAEKRAAERMAAQAAKEEARAAKEAAKEEAAAQEEAAEAAEKHRSKIKSLLSSLLGLNRGQKSVDGLTRQMTRFAISIFSVRKILSALQNALERASDDVQASWEAAGSSINNLFAGTVVSALQAMQPAIDRLNAALNSDSGQKLTRGLERLGSIAGQAIGFLLDKASQLVEFLGDNFQTVMAVAAIVAGVFAAQMLLSAGATALANLPLILFIGLVAALVIGLMKAGVTAEDIFGGIGSAAGWLYALVYNLIADAWNVIAVFAEFFANVFDDPVAAVARLFFGVFDSILGIVETVAGAIDVLLGTNMADAVSGFRSKMQAWVDDTYGESKIKIERMEKLDYADTMANFSSAASGLASSLSDFSLENMVGATLKDISEDTGKIAKSVNMADEDLKNLVDMAERQYVNQINLTAQTPIVTVNGANTGNTQADRQAMADVIRDILIEQVAAGSTRSTARAYSGG